MVSLRKEWSPIVRSVGYALVLLGALDPLEGALLILPGAALVLAAAWLGDADRGQVTYRLMLFLMIAFGVAALWGMSLLGGIGGDTGLSMGWALLAVPYVVGWSMELWGPQTPRWVTWAGIVAGLWFIAVPLLVIQRAPPELPRWPALSIGVVGILTIAGCSYRLLHRRATPPPAV